jgi:DNA-binding NtrC family response regulator
MPLRTVHAVTPQVDDGLQLLGDGPIAAQLRADIQLAARSDANVLIVGEPGAGKEVVARAIHKAGRRRAHRFVALNSAGLPDSLLESELFGHVRGSFTGAYRDKVGLAALADRGTLLLGEPGEMSPRMQGRLLQFVETLEIHRLGADQADGPVDVRIIAATSRSLLERVRSGDFREDLYYRLNVVHVPVPPLRERGTDILLLFNHYLALYCQIHGCEVPDVLPAAEHMLMEYSWPGNVRELKNIVERLVNRDQNGPLGPDALPLDMHRPATPPPSTVPAAVAGGSAAAARHPFRESRPESEVAAH